MNPKLNITLVFYVIGTIITTYLSFIIASSLKFISLNDLLRMYSLNISHVMLLIIFWSVYVSLSYFIWKTTGDKKIITMISILSALPYIGLIYLSLPFQYIGIILVGLIPIGLIATSSSYKEADLYKIIPYDKISVESIKRTHNIAILLIAIITALYITTLPIEYKEDEVSKLIESIANIKMDEINELENKIKEAEMIKLQITANATIAYVLNSIYTDNNLNNAQKYACIQSIQNNADDIVNKLKNDASNNIDLSMVSQNIEYIKKLHQTLVKSYPLIMFFLVYLILEIVVFSTYIIYALLIKIYKVIA